METQRDLSGKECSLAVSLIVVTVAEKMSYLSLTVSLLRWYTALSICFTHTKGRNFSPHGITELNSRNLLTVSVKL